jgi:hypothetical protein
LVETTLLKSLLINLEEGPFIHTLVLELAPTTDDGQPFTKTG